MQKTLALLLITSLVGCTSLPGLGPSTDGGAIGDGAAPADGAIVGPDDVVLAMDPFPIAAGEEVFRCQDFANPFGGARAEVREWESEMTAGSHHLLVFYKLAATNGRVAPCSGLEFASGPYGAQTPRAKITYPAGVATVVPAEVGFRFASHYVNASPNPIMAQVKLIVRRAPAGSTEHRAAVFFFNNTAINVPKAANPVDPPAVQVSKTCKVPRDVYFLYATGHMHQWATNLTATALGRTIYSTDTWDNSPFEAYSPPLFLPAGTEVTFTCTYKNTSEGALSFGESAKQNEMCIFDGQFYPDPTGVGFGC